MNVAIEAVTADRICHLISAADETKLTANAKKAFLNCVRLSTNLYVGTIDDKLICIWGLVPPTIASDQAYLWLHVTENFEGYEFIFIRRSQIAVQAMLQMYEVVVGHCEARNYKARRWLEWLGAKFDAPKNGLVPFRIVRTNDPS